MKKIFTAIFLLFFAAHVQAEIIVIGNKNNPLAFSSAQVQDIFMGRNRLLSNGQLAVPLDQASLRAEFYQRLIKQPIEQVDAYWKIIELSDKILSPQLSKAPKAPQIFSDDKQVLDEINKNKNAIGYIDRKNLNNNVRILLVIN